MTLLTNTIKDQDGGSTITVPTSGTFTLKNPSWTFLVENTPSTAASTIFTSTYITSTYDTYMVDIAGATCSADGVELLAQVGTDGSALISASDYTTNLSAKTGFELIGSVGSVGSGAGEGWSGFFYLYDPANSALFTKASWNIALSTASGTSGNDSVGGGYDEAATVNVLGFVAASGTISGTFRLWGKNKS